LKSFLSFEKEEIKEKTYGDGIFFGT
jgi:hypothetical protein